MNPEITKELLFKYFDGQATPIEKLMIDTWAKDGDNLDYFYACMLQWENQNLQFKPDTKIAFAKHLERVQTAETKISAETPTTLPLSTASIEIPSIHTRRRWWWAVAASLVFLLVAGGYFFKDVLMYQNYTTGFGKIESVTLSDGSQVVLNANSNLRVPRWGFGNATRTVFLTGEATFEVTHTVDNQRFIVETPNNFEVVVLGTVFSVLARQSGAKVVLDKGKVQLNYAENKVAKQLTLNTGEVASFKAGGKADVKKIKNPENYAAWKDHRFVFESMPLSDLATLFADNFGLELVIKDKQLAKWTISGSFTAHTAEELLETLTETANLMYRKDDTKIFISSK